jgi:hypothetical protein
LLGAAKTKIICFLRIFRNDAQEIKQEIVQLERLDVLHVNYRRFDLIGKLGRNVLCAANDLFSFSFSYLVAGQGIWLAISCYDIDYKVGCQHFDVKK